MPHPGPPRPPGPPGAPTPYGAPQYPPPAGGVPPGQYQPGAYPPGQSFPPPGMPASGQPNKNLAIASLVIGIVSLPLIFACGLGALTGIGAVVLGIIALSAARKQPGADTGRGLAIGGIVTGALALVLVVVAFTIGLLIDDSTSDFDGFNTDTPDGVCDPDRFMQDPDC